MKKLFAVYLRVRQKKLIWDWGGPLQEEVLQYWRRDNWTCCWQKNTGCKSETRTPDVLFEGASCCFQLHSQTSRLEDVCCPLCRDVSEIPLQHAGTFLHVVSSKPLLSWSTCLSGWSNFQATCLFIVLLSLPGRSSSLAPALGPHTWCNQVPRICLIAWASI